MHVKITHCYAVSQQDSTCMKLDTTAFISVIHSSSSFLKNHLFYAINVSSLGAGLNKTLAIICA